MVDKRAALLIASSEYDDTYFRPLKAPAQDVKALSRVLSDPAIGGFSEVNTLLNKPKDEVILAIEEFFDERNRADLLLLYFSCHGIKDKDGRLYYAAKNTRQKRLVATAVPAYEVNDLMLKSGSRRKILVLDCCYSGAFSKGFLAKGAGEVGAMEVFSQGQGLVTLTASDAFQPSLEEEEHGDTEVCSIFTRALVDGIETGKADRDGDRLISLDELYDYAYERVRSANPHQSPRIQGDVEGKIIIARNPQPPAPVELPPGLLQAMDNPAVEVRVAVVGELGKLLRGRNVGLALAAQAALVRMTDDDSRKVTSAAEKLLNETRLHSEAEAPPEPEIARAEAEERTRKQREQAIAKGRNDAAALFHDGDLQGAIVTLDKLIERFPDSVEANGDREAAVTAFARQQQEAKDRALIRLLHQKQAEEKARREAEEKARKQREQAIAKGRNDAANLYRSGDFQGAIAILDHLIDQFPDSVEAGRDREAAAAELAREMLEAKARAEKHAEKRAKRLAEEQARKQQEQTISKARNDAAALYRAGDFQGAISILDALVKQYPDNGDALRDRDAAAFALAKQQQEAQEKARVEAGNQAIAKGRNDAAALIRNGDFRGAIWILDALIKQFPDSTDAREDREAAADAFVRQREARNAERIAREKAGPETMPPPVPGASYASFGKRLLAYLIDFLIVALFCVPVSKALLSGSGVSQDSATSLLGLFFLLIDWLYEAAAIASVPQATWGMRIARVFVTDESGHRLSFGRASARYAAKLPSYFFLMAGFLIQPFTRNKQALHDIIAKTVVLHRPA